MSIFTHNSKLITPVSDALQLSSTRFFNSCRGFEQSIGIKQPVSAQATQLLTQNFILPPLVKKPSPSDTGLGEFIDHREKVP